MAFILFLIPLLLLLKDLNRRNSKERIMVAATFFLMLLFMFLYEYYVEHQCNWQYGIPFNDDTGWVFKASTALSEGTPINELYKLVLSNTYDLDNRAMSLTNLGQYIYVTFSSLFLYFPLIDIHFNLYLLYVTQILLVIYSGLRLSDTVGFIYNKHNSNKTNYLIFILFCFCPLILFNSFKLLRETFFAFFVVQFLYFSFRKKYLLGLLFAILAILFRPLIVCLVAPLFVYSINRRIGIIATVFIMFILLFSNSILNFAAKAVGWSYKVGTIEIGEMIHLLMFPNLIKQAKNMIEIANNPSYVVVYYFAQSIWNVVTLLLFSLSLINLYKRSIDWFFWLLVFVVSLMIYCVPYSVENMTPRYKFIYLIPYLVIIPQFLVKKRNKNKIERILR